MRVIPKSCKSRTHKKSRRLVLVIVVYLAVSLTVVAQSARQQTTSTGKKISPTLFGLFFEDINYAADGGLYAEMVQNRSFEYTPADRREWHSLTSWEYITPVFSYGALNVETNKPVHPNNPHYAVLTIEHVGQPGVGENSKVPENKGMPGVGIRNRGYDHMVVKSGEKYAFSLFACQLSATPVAFTVSLQARS